MTYEQQLKREGKCYVCLQVVDLNEFRDLPAIERFGRSGQCQACQDNADKLNEGKKHDDT